MKAEGKKAEGKTIECTLLHHCYIIRRTKRVEKRQIKALLPLRLYTQAVPRSNCLAICGISF